MFDGTVPSGAVIEELPIFFLTVFEEPLMLLGGVLEASVLPSLINDPPPPSFLEAFPA